MKKLFTDHIALWVILIFLMAAASLALSIVNTKRVSSLKPCVCPPPRTGNTTPSTGDEEENTSTEE